MKPPQVEASRQKGRGAARRRAALAALLLLTLALASAGASAESMPLTLERTVSMGLERNEGLKASREVLAASVWDRRAALLAYLPTGSLTSSVARVDEDSFTQANQARDGIVAMIDGLNQMPGVSIPAVEIDPFLYRNTYRTNLVINQEFPLNLHLLAGDRLSAAGERIARLSLLTSRDALVLSLRRGYFKLIAARELVIVAEQGLDSAENRRLLAVAREELGSINRAERMRWDVTLAEALSQASSARTLAILAEMELNRMLDQPLETALDPSPIDADALAWGHELAAMTALDLAERIIAESASAGALRAAGSAVEAGKLLALSGLTPSLHFAFGYGWRVNDTIALDDYQSWSATALLSVPLLDLAGNGARYRKAAAEQRRSEYETSNAIEGLRLAAHAAWHEVARAKENRRHRDVAEREAEETFALMTDRHELGQTSEFDLVDVQTSLTAARAQAVRARFDYFTALATLESLLGSRDGGAMGQGE
jgi:outer membrane protein